MTYEPPRPVDDLTDTEERIWNCVRWLRSRPAQGHCGSIESNYRSPQCWHPPGPRPLEPLGADAWDVVLSLAAMPVRDHLVIRLHYWFRLSPSKIAEIFRGEFKDRTKAIDVDHMRHSAVAALRDALSEPLAIRRHRAREKVFAVVGKTQQPDKD